MGHTTSVTSLIASVLLLGCNSGPPPGPCAAKGVTLTSRFPGGSKEGHADPTGAKAAGQARAGRIANAAILKQPANARQRIETSDYILVNDKIAVYIEGVGESDGYSPYGGEIMAIEPVDDDGIPKGVSQYGEMLMGLSRQAVDPDSVSVINDGSDGKAAIVRSSGRLKNIPFLDVFEGLAPDEFNFPAAIDYVLEPASETITIRLSLMNTEATAADLAGEQNIGVFQYARSRAFTQKEGFAMPVQDHPFVAFDGGPVGFAWRMPLGKMRFFIEASGFMLFQSDGLTLDACETKTVDYVQLIVGGPEIDGVLAAVRRLDGDTSFREVKGIVTESGGAPIPGALVHAVELDGKYLSRVTAGADGRFVMHAPPRAISLVATSAGRPATPALALQPGTTDVVVPFPAHATIVVHAKDATSLKALPVRVQVIPTTAPTELPASWGVRDEARGRLHQAFAHNGEATLVVPPGEHRVVVSRGFEYELHDQMVNLTAGQTTTIDAALLHSVDSTGVMCADFHIHSNYSADSNDPVDYKVKGAVADGLEIPVSSEHEWIIDFQPTIQALGLTEWAYGFPSEEFTTFSWGHFGVIPITPRPEKVNNGAVLWIGKKPPEVFKSIAELPEKPVLIINHPSGGGFGAYFSSTHFERSTAVGDPDMWSEQFGAIEVFNDSDLEANRTAAYADWIAMLDNGKIRWAVGSSDSHGLRTSPVGYPRTCLRFGHDDPTKLSANLVRDALAAGMATISGGLYMTVTGPGGAGPGAMLPAGAGALQFDVTVQAPGWLEASTLEVIVDGESVQTVQLQATAGPGPAKRYDAQITVTPTLTRPLHYVIFHAKTNSGDLSPVAPGRKPFAVSNPIFF